MKICEKDTMYLKVELSHIQQQLLDLQATVKEYVGKFDRPELICPTLLYMVDKDRFDKIAGQQQQERKSA